MQRAHLMLRAHFPSNYFCSDAGKGVSFMVCLCAQGQSDQRWIKELSWLFLHSLDGVEFSSLCRTFPLCSSFSFREKSQGAWTPRATLSCLLKKRLFRYSSSSGMIGLWAWPSPCSPPGKNLISLRLRGFGSWKQSLLTLHVAQEAAWLLPSQLWARSNSPNNTNQFFLL